MTPILPKADTSKREDEKNFYEFPVSQKAHLKPIRLLGFGATGHVLLCTPKSSTARSKYPKCVALKYIRDPTTDLTLPRPQVLHTLAETLRTTPHPNFPAVLDIHAPGDAKKYPRWYVMEHVPGCSIWELEKHIDKDCPHWLIAHIFLELCAASAFPEGEQNTAIS